MAMVLSTAWVAVEADVSGKPASHEELAVRAMRGEVHADQGKRTVSAAVAVLEVVLRLVIQPLRSDPLGDLHLS